MPDLTKGQITKANRKHSGKFAPKYRAFCVLQNKIEDVGNKSTSLWKSIYKVTNDKDDETNKTKASTKEQEEEKKIEKQETEKKEEKKGEEEKKCEEEKGEGENKEKEEEESDKGEDMAIAK